MPLRLETSLAAGQPSRPLPGRLGQPCRAAPSPFSPNSAGQTNQTTWANTDQLYTQATAINAQTGNSLQIAGSAVYNLTLGTGTNTLTTGGILVTNTAASGTSGLSGGNIVAPSGGELIVNNYDTAGSTSTIGNTEVIGVMGGGANNFGVTAAGCKCHHDFECRQFFHWNTHAEQRHIATQQCK